MNRQLVEDNLRLAYYVANKWHRITGLSVEDCVSICFEGLCIAAKNYRPEKGSKFSTYAGVSMDSLFIKRKRDNNAVKRSGETVPFSLVIAEHGEPLTLEDAIGVEDDNSVFDYGIPDLEGRERDIAYMRLQGYSQMEIAEHLEISQVHVSRLLNKLREKIRC